MTTRNETDQALSSLLEQLKQGRLSARDVIAPLRDLLKRDPNHAGVHYNLGLALSDRGDLPEAVMHLKRAAKHAPTNVNALTGLGTAYGRMGKWVQAREALEQALQLRPDDPYAKRSLGTTIAQAGDYPRALALLRDAHEAMPQDEIAHISLGLTLLESSYKEPDAQKQVELEQEANRVLKSFLAQHPVSAAAEQAVEACNRIAAQVIRRTGGGIRPDVVMYIAGALKRFKTQGPELRNRLARDIALLGQSGLEINDSSKRYTLDALPGEDFSGLHLLAIMYAALQQLSPEIDCGVDFSREYQMALPLAEAE